MEIYLIFDDPAFIALLLLILVVFYSNCVYSLRVYHI